ncbi:WD repeat and coiled-coil-containing protein-like [Hyperolius riggenbachi]
MVNAVMLNPGREAQLGKQQIYYSEMKDVLSHCSRPMSYPSSEEPPYITITHQRSPEDRSDTRAILLCHGKLHLSTVRDVFHLQNIEMMFGSKWIVLTEDQEGFTPIIFRANQEVEIREAKHLSTPLLP